MNNTSIGSSSEKSASTILRENGFWVHTFSKSANGSQPVDIIAVKGNKELCFVFLIDAKHVEISKPSFTFDRIEPNQWATLLYAKEYAHIDERGLGFVIEFDRTKDFYWLPYKKAYEMYSNGYKSIKYQELELFEEVVKRCAH